MFLNASQGSFNNSLYLQMNWGPGRSISLGHAQFSKAVFVYKGSRVAAPVSEHDPEDMEDRHSVLQHWMTPSREQLTLQVSREQDPDVDLAVDGAVVVGMFLVGNWASRFSAGSLFSRWTSRPFLT